MYIRDVDAWQASAASDVQAPARRLVNKPPPDAVKAQRIAAGTQAHDVVASRGGA
jgi:hypothetical protein